MDWDKLKIFHAVAEAGSFTSATVLLNLSQSAISRQIQSLEDDLKVKLFERHARGLTLTENGEYVFKTAHEVIGKLKESFILASETCALDIIGANFIREVENGEIVAVEDNKLKSIKPFPKHKPRPCVFEYIYFARPDSIINGKCAYEYRKNFN